MKTKIVNYFIAAGVVLMASSCDNFLDIKPVSDNTTANAYQTAKDAEAALTGVYDSFQAEFYVWDNVNFSDVLSDNCYAGGDNAEIYAIDDLNIQPTNSRLFNNWTQIYNAISKANVVLAVVPGIKDETLDASGRRAQIVGEASFLRAYHYYQLVKAWGGVPLVIQPVTSTDPAETQIPKSTAQEVYNQIVTDLEVAVTNLPDTYGSDGSVNKARATKGAANALLAKVWAQREDRDYTKVITYCNAVINSPAGYQLLGNYSDLWDGTHYNNSESILEVQYIGGTEANFGPQLLLPPSISGDTWRKFVTPSHNLIDAFNSEGDAIRRNASVLMENAPWADEFWSLTVGGPVPFSYKWKSANGWASTNRQYLLRLADIILLKAEALNQSGQTEAARTEINRIRTRVSLANTPAADQASMRIAIDKERRLELVQEAQRWDDLVRLDRAVTVMKALVEIDLRTGNPKDFSGMTAQKQLLPIPQAERNRNLKLDQNEGYN